MLNVINIFIQYVFCLLLFLNFESYLGRFCLSLGTEKNHPFLLAFTPCLYLGSTWNPCLCPGWPVGPAWPLSTLVSKTIFFYTFITDSVSWAQGLAVAVPGLPGHRLHVDPTPEFPTGASQGSLTSLLLKVLPGYFRFLKTFPPTRAL